MTGRGPFAVVVFDCDSTLTAVEGVDELARRQGLGDEVSTLTAAAMHGEVSLEDVYRKRLDLIRPDATALDWLGREYVARLVPGAAETIRILRGLGKEVHIVSGGFRQAVVVLADALGIAADHVHAVQIVLDGQGGYRSFDQSSPLARSGGKAEICAMLATAGNAVVAVGDGVTDLEMREGGAWVIGFGGVAARPAVRAGADVFIDGPSLTAVLQHVLQPAERRRAGLA